MLERVERSAVDRMNNDRHPQVRCGITAKDPALRAVPVSYTHLTLPTKA